MMTAAQQWNRDYDDARSETAARYARAHEKTLREAHAQFRLTLASNPNSARALGACAAIADLLDARRSYHEICQDCGCDPADSIDAMTCNCGCH